MSEQAVVPFSGRLRKLRAMSRREVQHRVHYAAILKLERWQHARGTLAPADRLERALASGIRGAQWRERLLASRRQAPSWFGITPACTPALREVFEGRFASERAKALAHADSTREHRFEFFGGEYRYGQEIPWQNDPVTGRAWPSWYHADVPIHGGDVGYGDVKHVWELSRQQYLVDLAKAHLLTGDPGYLAAMRHLVSSWIAGNPYGTGINWSCALEPAFRVLSWAWAYQMTAPALDDDFHVEWIRGFYDHARFLDRHLEEYSSPYNHLIGEAAALFAVAVAFPEFADARRWRERARRVLEGRLAEQFYADGGTAEQSSFYHHATLGFYLLAATLGKQHAADLSADVWRAIERALDFSAALAQPDGSTPEIGGADDGKPIRLEHLPFWDFRPYYAIGAVLFGRPDLKYLAGRFYEDALWIVGLDGMKTFDALQPAAPAQQSVSLPSSGYLVTRSGWSSSADYVCFDVGEQAAGMRTDSVPNSMHGHADCLSLVVWLDGKRVLADSGLYAYNCGGEWEAHFRETAAHSTARIDGRDQARHIGKMAWSHSYRAAMEQWNASNAGCWAIGSHDGYARGPLGVTHRRAIWLRPAGYVLVLDEFSGGGRHDLEVNYQFAPGALTNPENDGVRFDETVDVAWLGSHQWTGRTACGGERPQDGWICTSLGVRVPAPRLTMTREMTEPRTTVVTVLASRARVRGVRRVQQGGGALLAIQAGERTEWITAAGIGEGTALESDGLLGICAVDASGIVEQVVAGGTSLRADLHRLTRTRSAVEPLCVG